MSTFKFSDVEIEKLDERDIHVADLSDRPRGQKFYDKENDIILKTSATSGKIMYPYLGNGLLGTIYQSYCDHIPLVLRADDLWLAILLNFGRYTQNHSEEMRDLFVDHLGRKELVVQVKSPLMKLTTEEDWESFVDLMSYEIQNNTKTDLVEWMTPNFSTTTKKDKMVAQIAMMSTVSDYFEMKGEMSCGLTEVTLEGCLNDWQMLYNKARELYKFNVPELNAWADLLLPVLNEFIKAYQGEVDVDFWQRICTSKRRGSGGQKNFKGWFLVFSPFDEQVKYLLRSPEEVSKDHIYGIVADDDICDCSVNVQVIVDDHLNNPQGKRYHVFYAGLLMTHYNAEKNQLSPTVDWILIEKKEIMLEDLQKRLTSNFAGENLSKEKMKMLQTLVKFSYDVAVASHFPNEVLIDLVKTVSSYHYNFLYEKENQTCEKFLEFLASPLHYRYKPNKLAKYIDPERFAELLKLGVNVM